jgi:hypothetical protein
MSLVPKLCWGARRVEALLRKTRDADGTQSINDESENRVYT